MRYLSPVLALTIWSVLGDLHAGISAPIPFARLSADESKILVVRKEGSRISKSVVSYPRQLTGKKIDFLAEFPTSGVYRLASRELIYGIDWFCLDEELLSSSDLVHLARLNRFGNPWALKFYSSGKETATYNLDAFLKAFADERFRPFSSWDWYYPWHESFELRGSKVVVTTVKRVVARLPIGYHEIYTFDIATGLFEREGIFSLRYIALLAGFAAIIIMPLVTVILAIRAKRNESRQQVGAPNP